MKDNVRKELKELCYYIIENNNALARPEQLTRVQMLYERLLVLNYLEEVEEEKKAELKAKSQSPKSTPSPSAPENQFPPAPESPTTSPETALKVETPKPEEVPISSSAPEKPLEETVPEEVKMEETALDRRDLNDDHEAPKSVNDQLGKGPIQVGLNDRIAFVKHLFNDSQADFNRVLSQLNTLDTYLESMYFIENLVKPDYAWDDKKDYEERLINLVKKRFGEDW